MLEASNLSGVVARNLSGLEGRKGRKEGKKNLPRDIAIYLARDLTGETTVMLGKKFGNILEAAISQRHIAFEEQMNKTKSINRQMMRIREKILDN